MINDLSDNQRLRLEFQRDGEIQAVLHGEKLEARLWRLTEWQVFSESDTLQAEWSVYLDQHGQGRRFLSNNRPERQPLNALLEQAGWRVTQRKGYFTRTLEGTLPHWPGQATLTLLPLSQAGQAQFQDIMLRASAGDPFHTTTAATAQQEFQDLIGSAGPLYRPDFWFIAQQDGVEVGLILPQQYPDEPGTGTLFYIGVLPAFRGRHLGRALHALGLQLLARRGATLYVGSTDLQNHSMLRIFQANGCFSTHQQLFYEQP